MPANSSPSREQYYDCTSPSSTTPRLRTDAAPARSPQTPSAEHPHGWRQAHGHFCDGAQVTSAQKLSDSLYRILHFAASFCIFIIPSPICQTRTPLIRQLLMLLAPAVEPIHAPRRNPRESRSACRLAVGPLDPRRHLLPISTAPTRRSLNPHPPPSTAGGVSHAVVM